MDVLFIQELYYDYIGVMALSAALKQKGISTDLIIERNPEKVVAYIKRHSPEMVCFSVISGIHQFPARMSRAIKAAFPDLPVIAGGPHPTFFPGYISEGAFDALCVGEGDVAIVKYYRAVTGDLPLGEVPNLIYKQDGKIRKNPVGRLIEDLDRLPFPDRSVYDKYRMFSRAETKGFVTSRGCPYNCSFCYNRKAKEIYKGKGRFHRMRSPENVVAEILAVADSYPSLRTVLFVGDTVFYTKKWAARFLELYREKVDLPFSGLVAADIIDEEIGRLLKQARCHSIFFGIESGNERIRKEILKKNISDRQIASAADILRRNNIACRTFNMVGIPTETLENMFETIRMNVDVRARHPWCSIFVPYPGTELFDIAVESGELDRDFSCDQLPRSYMEKCVLNRPDRSQVENIHKLFKTAVRHPGLIPLIRRLIRLKPNLLFKLWFGLNYMSTIKSTERRSFKTVIPLVLKNFGFFITGKGRNPTDA